MWNRLGELGCDIGQGYYLSRPVPAAALTEWLEAARAAAAG
jgi:EAL domain-containing protein (putative c-di-GMP-specific phosphodiesterase class I)